MEMKFNLLMVTDVVRLLLLHTPRQVALVRSAGCVGSQAFQENVEQDRVPMYGMIVEAASPREGDNEDDIESSLPSASSPLELVPISIHGLLTDPSSKWGDVDNNKNNCIHLHAVVITMPTFLHSIDPDLARVFANNMSLLHNTLLHVKHLVFTYHRHFKDSVQYTGVMAEYNMSDVESRLANFLDPTHMHYHTSSPPASSSSSEKDANEQQQHQLLSVSMFGYCKSLKSIDFGGVSGVFGALTDINSCFANNCVSLRSIDLSPFMNVTNIGCEFLEGCTGITQIDLSPFISVDTISFNFMSGCTSLTEIDCSVFSNVTEIQWRFLADCSSLQNINLSGFTNVDTVEWGFLKGCTSLSSVDLTAFHNVTIIEEEFLNRCDTLQQQQQQPLPTSSSPSSQFIPIDMTGMGKLTELPPKILEEYPKPGQVIVPPHLQQKQDDGDEGVVKVAVVAESNPV